MTAWAVSRKRRDDQLVPGSSPPGLDLALSAWHQIRT
jgi:hypothetical protein